MPDGFRKTPIEDLVKGVSFEVDSGGVFAFTGIDLEERTFFRSILLSNVRIRHLAYSGKPVSVSSIE